MTETPQQPTPQPVALQPAALQPPGGQPQGNGLAVAGMILGIVGLALFCLWYIALPCAIVGLILSIKGKKKSKITGTGAGMATAGLVLSIVAIALDIVIMILALTVGLAILGAAKEAADEAKKTTMLFVRSFLA